jgi:hypothetical protein
MQDTDLGRSTGNLKDGTLSPEPEKRSLFDKFKAKVAHMKDGTADRERAKSPPQSDTELSVASSQNLSQIAKEGRNGRVCTDQPRESIDAAHDTAMSHQTIAVSPPVILEEPSTPPAVNPTLQSEDTPAPAAEPAALTVSAAEAKVATPEIKTEEPTPVEETHIGTNASSDTKYPELKRSAEGGDAPTITTMTKVALPKPEIAENI